MGEDMLLLKSLIRLSAVLMAIGLLVGAPANYFASEDTDKKVESSGPEYIAVPVHVRELFYTLKKAAGPNSERLRLYAVKNNSVNAWINSSGGVYVTSALLEFTKYSEDQLASVLAHEIGHWELGHLKTIAVGHRDSKRDERNADVFGYFLMDRAGYDRCAASRFWKKMIAKYGMRESFTHPSHFDRYMYLRCTK